MNKDWMKRFALWLAVFAAVLCTGCSVGRGYEPVMPESAAQQEETDTAEPEETDSAEPEETDTAKPEETDTAQQEETDTAEPESTAAPASEAGIDPDGSYTSCEDVALYLETFGELPDNFITKKEARALGWEGGSLEPYAPGKCIGGDKFGNYEGLLPEEEGRIYHECDIDTLGAKSRGAKRIVYSSDGLIYYTEDHYESFTLLYD